MVWYSHLFQNFPQFIVIHTVKGFGIVNKAEIAGVQLQQPGIQPEEMNSVGDEAASQFSWTDCLFQAYDSLLYFYKSIRSEV